MASEVSRASLTARVASATSSRERGSVGSDTRSGSAGEVAVDEDLDDAAASGGGDRDVLEDESGRRERRFEVGADLLGGGHAGPSPL